jgi:hypothetical protein
MTTRRPSSNILFIAFAAIVGMLSFADVTSACSTKPVSAPKACCASRPSSDCGCCGDSLKHSTSLGSSRAGAILPTASEHLSRASAPSCECRASEPAAPGERPAQRASSDRFEAATGETLPAFSLEVRPSPAFGHMLQPNQSPPKSPIYLSTSRLLI